MCAGMLQATCLLSLAFLSRVLDRLVGGGLQDWGRSSRGPSPPYHFSGRLVFLSFCWCIRERFDLVLANTRPFYTHPWKSILLMHWVTKLPNLHFPSSLMSCDTPRFLLSKIYPKFHPQSTSSMAMLVLVKVLPFNDSSISTKFT